MKRFLAIAVIAAVGVAGTPAMAGKTHKIKLRPGEAATVKIHCINSHLRRHQKAKIRLTRIMNNWLEVIFKEDISKEDAEAMFSVAKESCGVAEES